MKKISLKSLSIGVNYVDNLLIYKKSDGSLNICQNKCKHMGGRFGKCSKEDSVVCKRHNWELDLASLKYVSPKGLGQESIEWQVKDGEVVIYDDERLDKSNPDVIKTLSPKEFKIKFYAHACVEVMWNNNSFFTDPWLVGPAFTKGWWLMHKPPKDWLERIANCNGIYVSHNHSDHLNIHTLRLVAEKNSLVPIYIPNFDSNSSYNILNDIGFKNINVIDFDKKININGLNFTIYQDTAGKDDSGILFDYKGHRILNTVDCKNIKSYNIKNVKVLLKEFSSGASGYPVCWQDQYENNVIDKVIKLNRVSIRKNVLDAVVRFQPKVFIPFAGYFSESYYSDKTIKHINQKNNPEEINEFLTSKIKNLKTWTPASGRELDLYDYSTIEYTGEYYTDKEKDFYVQEYTDGPHIAAYEKNRKEYQKYFGSLGFHGDLLLHVVETNEDYTVNKNQFYVDFSDQTSQVLEEKPNKKLRRLNIKVRSDVFRYVLFHGLPWEEFSIGFQARFTRTPDKYNLDFWNHVQNKIPKNIKNRGLL